MQVVVEVLVGDGIAGLGPVEKCTPPVLEQGVDAAVRGSAVVRVYIAVDATHLGQSFDPISLRVP